MNPDFMGNSFDLVSRFLGYGFDVIDTWFNRNNVLIMTAIFCGFVDQLILLNANVPGCPVESNRLSCFDSCRILNKMEMMR